MTLLAGADLGTSSLKVLIMDENGGVHGDFSQDYQYDAPINGYGEQDIDVWWEACVQCFRKAAEKAGAANIAGISFSGQMHGAVFLDEGMEQVRPAILHLDARSGRQIEGMRAVLGPELIRRVLMNPPYSGFLIPSLLWVKENEPDHYRRIRHVMLPKDYLRLRLCGEWGSDYSDASATLAFDIRRMVWSDEVLKALDIPPALFPECHATDAVVGKVTPEAAAATGLLAGTPVAAGGGDQVMQSIGNGAILPGQATVNIGTSAQVSFQSDHPVENPRLNTNTFCGYGKGRWYTMGATMSAGLSMRWLGSVLERGYQELDARAGLAAPGSGGLLFLPYLTGERTPHLNPDISGMIWGLNINTGMGQIARSVMEGVAYSLRECMEVCQSLGLPAGELIASGGGAKSPLWLQIQADVLGVPLKVADIGEHACVGAAIAAGSGAGVYRDIADGCDRVVRYQEKRYFPNPKHQAAYRQYFRLYKQAYEDSQNTLEALTALGRRQ